MNYFLLSSLVILLIALVLVSWRYLDLRRALREYARRIRRAASGSEALPDDQKGLEELGSALHSLVSNFGLELTALNAEHSRLAAVLEQMTDGVLIADSRGQIQFANPAAERLFERPGAVGHSVAEVIRHHQLVETWRRAQLNREMQSESVEIPSRRQFVQLVAIPDKHAGGSLLLVQDLTRVRRLETVRRDFISNLSHELRTPLASLKALTETLQGGALADPEAGARFLGRIVTEVDALTQMAQELLDLSRIESGQVTLDLAPVDPRELLLSAVERMKLQAERAGTSLQVDCPDNLPAVRADAARLEQVLVNLIHNAVKFSRLGGEVLLQAAPIPGHVEFAVKDHGVGIPADDLARIFERFYRVDRSRSGGGTGLGLSIARHIVEAHNGEIRAESEEGRGSSFYFTVPLA